MAVTYPSVRVYGPGDGTNSFRALARGICQALEELGVTWAFCPTDAQMEEAWGDAPGRGMDIGLFVGNPSFLHFVSAHTAHKRKYAMIAPNGYGVPPWVLTYCKADKLDVLTPSHWGADVLRPMTPRPVTVYPHGASTTPPTDAEKAVRLARMAEVIGGAKIRFLHTTSTGSDRKGTRALLRAWKAVMAHEWATLLVHAPPEVACHFDYPPGVIPSTAKIAAPSWSAALRQFDMVLQPSAAEGFGLVPLEALCAGVPVLLTAATGEQEYTNDPMFTSCTDMPATPFICCDSHPRGPVDGEEYDGHPPDEDSLALALAESQEFLREKEPYWNLLHCALEWAPRVHARWSWTATTRDWLNSLTLPAGKNP